MTINVDAVTTELEEASREFHQKICNIFTNAGIEVTVTNDDGYNIDDAAGDVEDLVVHIFKSYVQSCEDAGIDI